MMTGKAISAMPTATTRTTPEAATARIPAANSQVIGADGVVYGYDGNVSFGSPAWKFGEDAGNKSRLASPWSQRTYNDYKSEYSLTTPLPKGEIMYHDGKRQNYYPDTTIGGVN